MYCGYCGAQIENDAKFCPNCGKTVQSESTYKQSEAKTGGADTEWAKWMDRFDLVIGKIPPIVEIALAAMASVFFAFLMYGMLVEISCRVPENGIVDGLLFNWGFWKRLIIIAAAMIFLLSLYYTMFKRKYPLYIFGCKKGISRIFRIMAKIFEVLGYIFLAALVINNLYLYGISWSLVRGIEGLIIWDFISGVFGFLSMLFENDTFFEEEFQKMISD